MLNTLIAQICTWLLIIIVGSYLLVDHFKPNLITSKVNVIAGSSSIIGVLIIAVCEFQAISIYLGSL